ncbi:hypothetical protein [Ornithinicoccus hortensis]|uniref:Uncharacterized protein n=1 Tax=Ornithinicoccus hortensis TaxID=82346 RepID=A0A542YWP3_9MICO|nr:hypothetical protein [Ornithinicoccus hortensis]TQL52505.1 hypothetical protein FB467_3693 [Ornithinicoccus hortensis]
MGRSKRPPRRDATRKRQALSIVPPARATATTIADGSEPPIDPVVGSLLADIALARDAFQAELVLCEVFRATQLGLPVGTDEEERLEMQSHLLHEVITHAGTLRSADALALLRVCSTLGPQTTREAARAEAGRLADAGVPDRPWAGLVGHPRLLSAWHYGDTFGEQESVGALFDYAGRDHAMMILIDHDLGGGVKDAWLAKGRRATDLRNRVASGLEDNPEAIFRDVDAADVVRVLDQALDRPACPREPDQIEDVACYLDLVRSRVDSLREPA